MKRNLLLCFDAFGTIYKPRRPVFEQYGEVARAHGLSGFTDEQVATSFIKAFKAESKAHPNFGKAVDMGSEKWWTNVIESTFKPLQMEKGARLPPKLAPALISRFDSKDGHEIFPDVLGYLKRLSKSTHRQRISMSTLAEPRDEQGRLIVGVITNSDNRVPDILSSLDLRVNALRHGSSVQDHQEDAEGDDVDFVIMSYDVGHEKPDRRIFDAASSMLKDILVAEGQKEADIEQWNMLYVGDELEKDAVGAIDAGWDAILVDREGAHDNGVFVDSEDDDQEAPRKHLHADREITVLRSLAGLTWLRERFPLLFTDKMLGNGKVR